MVVLEGILMLSGLFWVAGTAVATLIGIVSVLDSNISNRVRRLRDDDEALEMMGTCAWYVAFGLFWPLFISYWVVEPFISSGAIIFWRASRAVVTKATKRLKGPSAGVGGLALCDNKPTRKSNIWLQADNINERK